MTAFCAFYLRIPATSANLGPGFDSFGLALTVHNHFTVTPHPFFSVKITGYSDPELEHTESNLVFNVYRQICRENHWQPIPFHLVNDNHIPLYGGIGSSASAIVAAIAIANTIHNACWTKHDMLRIAYAFEKHLDNIAAAIFGGFVVAAGYLDEHTPSLVHKQITNKLCAWVIVPHLRVSTNAARATLPATTSYDKAIFNLSHAAQTSIAFEREDWLLLRKTVVDSLHQPFRHEQCAKLLDIRPQLIDLGCYSISISGSGPAVLVLCDSPNDAMRKLVRTHMQIQNIQWSELSLRVDNHGLIIKQPETL